MTGCRDRPAQPSTATPVGVRTVRAVRCSRLSEIDTADAARELLLAMTLHITFVFEEGVDTMHRGGGGGVCVWGGCSRAQGVLPHAPVSFFTAACAPPLWVGGLPHARVSLLTAACAPAAFVCAANTTGRIDPEALSASLSQTLGLYPSFAGRVTGTKIRLCNTGATFEVVRAPGKASELPQAVSWGRPDKPTSPPCPGAGTGRTHKGSLQSGERMVVCISPMPSV